MDDQLLAQRLIAEVRAVLPQLAHALSEVLPAHSDEASSLSRSRLNGLANALHGSRAGSPAPERLKLYDKELQRLLNSSAANSQQQRLYQTLRELTSSQSELFTKLNAGLALPAPRPDAPDRLRFQLAQMAVGLAQLLAASAPLRAEICSKGGMEW